MAESEKLYFDTIKEDRGQYFVEYQPPANDNRFAILALVYPGPFEAGEVKSAMRAELTVWLARYPVPIMVTAFDAAEDVIRSNGVEDDGHLVGWIDPATGDVRNSWNLNDLTPVLDSGMPLADWRKIYRDVSFRTETEVRDARQIHLDQVRKQNRALRIAVIAWLSVIPAAAAALEYFGPDWLALGVFVLALWKAFQQWRELTGRKKPSREEKEKSEKERKMAHYYYHCELNPDAFARLRAENFAKNIEERTRQEAEELKKKSTA